MESRLQLVEQARQALDDEDDERARMFALRAADCKLDGSELDWAVVDLVIAVDVVDKALSLARKICARFDRVSDTIHMAHVLAEIGDVDTALSELRHVLPRASANEGRAIGERLLHVAMAQEDMEVVHEAAHGSLPIADQASRDWLMAAGRRALELSSAGELFMEPRRSGYVFGGHVVLGGEECTGDHVEDYWFYTYDTYSISWLLRRFAALASALGWSFKSIVAGDAACAPIALAATQMLGELDRPQHNGALLRIVGPQTGEVAPPAVDSKDIVLALGYDGDWYRLGDGLHIDIVGIPAGGEIDWGEDGREARDIADEILAALEELPPDPAMGGIVAFYRRHRHRTPALEYLEQA